MQRFWDWLGRKLLTRHVQLLRLQKGDVLAVGLPENVGQDQAMAVKAMVQTIVPAGVSVMVLVEGVSLGIVRADRLAEAV